jgi:hypothetical protein
MMPDAKHRAYLNYRKSVKGIAYRARREARRQALKAFVNSLKNKPCADCQGWFMPHQMDFDHRLGINKLAGICELITCHRSKKEILTEIKKCDLVCANCHRDRTYQRQRRKEL